MIEKQSGRQPLAPVLGLSLLVLALVGWLGRDWLAGPAGPDPASLPVFAARLEPLAISVTESGTIQPREQEVLKSQVEGRTTILFLVPEGEKVEAGRVLVELDASRLQESRVDQEIRVENARSAAIRARENLAVVENQAASDVEKAQTDLAFARMDRDKYDQGELPKELKEAETRIALAQEDLRRAEEKLRWSRILFDEQYLSQTELSADEIAARKAGLDLELAVASRDLLRDFTASRRRAELASGLSQATMALERARRKAAADVIQARAEVKAKEAELAREEEKLARIHDQLDKTLIRAPADGQVVYATSGRQLSFRGNTEPLAEGQEVVERQDLIILPRAGAFSAEVKIHESSLKKIAIGQRVRLTVVALPGAVFTGRVTAIAPLPDPQSLWLSPDLKVYSTSIEIDGDGDGLRTGMSCQAEILVDRIEQALVVPVQAVRRAGGQALVWVRTGGAVRPQPVELGPDNNRFVQIASGLAPGEEVLLAPPAAEGPDTPGPVQERAKGAGRPDRPPPRP
ncbi:MAG: HlyD family efflux transporter periplasmic adaptor subunit [Thermodesulfobacteriota bacterium]